MGMKNKKKLLLVSFDAVGSEYELPVLRTLPNFRRAFANGSVYSGLRTVFISNTYPIHASIVTGVTPAGHGLISNTKLMPETTHPDWNYDSRLLRMEPIWQTAAKAGLRTAAVMWPVTGYAKEIRWNIGEIMARPGENQIAANLRTCSKLTQILAVIRHGHILKGIEQPERDCFAAHCTRDIIRFFHPDLTLMHFTAYDTICHERGRGSEEALNALRDMDTYFGLLLDAIDDNTVVIGFSDHAQLNVHTAFDPNRILDAMGFLTYHDDGTCSDEKAVFQNAGGSSFFFNRSLSEQQVNAVRERIRSEDAVRRLLSDAEMAESGYAGIAAFGICAQQGYCFDLSNHEKAVHGYPLDMPDYHVFMAVSEPYGELETDCILEVYKAVRTILSL